MWLKKIKSKDLICLAILLIIGAFIYHRWLSFSVFTSGDWWFSFKENLISASYPNAYGLWGGALLWKYPYFFLEGVFGLLGFASNVAEKFIVFWQIAFLTPIAGYLFVKKIAKSQLAGFIGSLVFAYNTYFLSIDTQGHELLTVAFTWGTLALLSFIYLLESKKKFYIPATSLLLFITAFYDLRSLYVVIGVMFLYFIYSQLILEKTWKSNLKNHFINYFLVGALLFGLSLYWLLPVLNLHSLSNNEFLIRSLFGSEFYNIQNSITLFYPFWTGKEPTWLYLQKIPMSFWLYPLLAFSALIVERKNKRLAFFGLLAVLGIFLTKQEGAPFGFVYKWFYLHLPGFNAFREASKFDFVTLIAYSVLIAIFSERLVNYFKNIKIKKILFLALCAFPLINAIPLLTGDINTLFIPKKIPSNFENLSRFIQKDPSYSRVLGINQSNSYIYSTDNHTEIDLSNGIRHVWGTDLLSFDPEDMKRNEGQRLTDYLSTDEGRRLVSQISVGYLVLYVVDKPTNQNLRRDTGKNIAYFEKSLSGISYLEKTNTNFTNLVVYKNLSFKPHLYLTKERETLKKDIPFEKVYFKEINPEQYEIQFNNVKGKTYLNFSELYENGWEIHIGKFNWQSVFLSKNYSLLDSDHYQTDIRYNGFIIDTAEVCSVYKCTKNSDGSSNFQATLYFKAESYLYLGLILTGITLLGSVFSLIYLKRKDE